MAEAEAAAEAAPSRPRWLWLSMGLCSAVVLATCLPVLWHPQLEPDDYRYLDQLQSLKRGAPGSSVVEAFVVENRWDHLWWVDTDQRVRFFRPLVLLSYGLDGPSARGLLATNLLLHWACVLLVGFLLWRWLGPGLPALVGATGFAALHCHSEVIYYVAGRTDTLAALGVLAGLALHVGPRRRALRWLGLLGFAFALAAKELGLVLPALCVLHELWNGARRRRLVEVLRADWRLWAAYAAVAVVWLAARQLVVGAGGFVFPYFVAPTHAGFAAHLWTQLRSYSENLLLARSTPPFLQPEYLGQWSSGWGLALTVAVLAAVVVLLRRERRFWFCAAAAVLAWLLTCCVYVSERYLYLPSFAAAGVAALVVARFDDRRWRIGLAALGLAWAGYQGWMLGAKNLRLLGSPRSALVVERQLAAAASRIPKGAHLLFVNLPGDWLHAQFAAAQARVALRDPDLTVDVLTVMPWDALQGARMDVRQDGPRSLTLAAAPLPAPDGPASVMMTERYFEFPWVALDTGRTYAARRPPGLVAEVLEGHGRSAQRMKFTLPRPLAEYVLCVWTPGDAPGRHWLERRLESRLQVVGAGGR
jgi:hypothetical protein